jgi:sugar-phosphatase
MRLHAALLDLDTVTNPLMQRISVLVNAGEDLDHVALRGPVHTARYRCLWDTAAENADTGLDVVLVAPFTAELADERVWHRSRNNLPGTYRTWLVQVLVTETEARRRRAQRGLPRDLAYLARESTQPTARTVTAAPSRHADFHVDGTADTDQECARLAAAVTAGCSE